MLCFAVINNNKKTRCVDECGLYSWVYHRSFLGIIMLILRRRNRTVIAMDGVMVFCTRRRLRTRKAYVVFPCEVATGTNKTRRPGPILQPPVGISMTTNTRLWMRCNNPPAICPSFLLRLPEQQRRTKRLRLPIPPPP